MVVEGGGKKPAWAIITGGASGLGREITKALLKKGFNVILTCRNTKVGEQACYSIKGELGRAQYGVLEFAQVDMGDLSTIRRFAEQVEEKQFYVALLINNAAVWAPLAGDKTRSGMDLSFGVNYVGPFLLTNLLLPIMNRQTGISKIINIGCGEYAKCEQINMRFIYHEAKTVVAPGALKVTVEWARGLARVSAKSKANPYVRVSFRGKEFLTKVVKNSLNPSWNETFAYADVDVLEGSVELTIMDKGPFGSDIEIGRASIPLSGLSATSPNSLDSALSIEVALDFSKRGGDDAKAAAAKQFNDELAHQSESIIMDSTTAVIPEACEGVKYAEGSTRFVVMKRINILKTSRRVIVVDTKKRELRNETIHQRIRKQFPFEQILNLKFVEDSDTKIRICFIPRDMKIKGHDVPGGQRPYDLDFMSKEQRNIFVQTLSGFVLSTVMFSNGRYVYKVVKQLNAAERDIRLLILDIHQKKIYLVDADADELSERLLQDAFAGGDKAKGFFMSQLLSLHIPDPKNPLILSIAFQNGVKWQVEFVALDQRYQFEKIVRPFIPVPAQGRIRVSMMHTRAVSATSGSAGTGGRFSHIVPHRALIEAPRPNPALAAAGQAHLVPWVSYEPARPPPVPEWAEAGWDTAAPGSRQAGAIVGGPAVWTPLEASQHSKLCLASFTFELARRLEEEGSRVRVHMLDPGRLRTPMLRKALGLGRTWRRWAVWWAMRYGLPPERAAAVVAQMAVQPVYEECNGLYVELWNGYSRVVNKPSKDKEGNVVPNRAAAHPNRPATDRAAAARLWDATVAMVNYGYDEPYKIMLGV